MYDVFTETENLCTRGVDLEQAEDIAEGYAREGHQVEIRDEDTGETIKLYNCEEED